MSLTCIWLQSVIPILGSVEPVTHTSFRPLTPLSAKLSWSRTMQHLPPSRIYTTHSVLGEPCTLNPIAHFFYTPVQARWNHRHALPSLSRPTARRFDGVLYLESDKQYPWKTHACAVWRWRLYTCAKTGRLSKSVEKKYNYNFTLMTSE